MAVRESSLAEILAIAGTRLPNSGARVLLMDEADYYRQLLAGLQLIDQSLASWLQVKRDDSTPATVRIMPGRAAIDGRALSYPGGTLDLAAYNTAAAFVWAYQIDGQLTIGHGMASAGWPAINHLKLAQVSVASGAVAVITDRRAEHILMPAHQQLHYNLAIETQGDTTSPSILVIQLCDASGESVKAADRLRVCVSDQATYQPATHATIDAGEDTSIDQVVEAGVDLVLTSDPVGKFVVELTNTEAETVTLRIGPPPLGGRVADYTAAIDVTHA